MDTTTDPPTPMVHVQWAGLPLEDTSWESWDSLQTAYHLEDKVNFPAPGDVSTSTDKVQHNNKPKRVINKLAHLQGYV
jgi:hypothetical protein